MSGSKNKMRNLLFPNTRKPGPVVGYPAKVETFADFTMLESRIWRMSHKVIMWSLNIDMLRRSLAYVDYERMIQSWYIACKHLSGVASLTCMLEIEKHFRFKLNLIRNAHKAIWVARDLMLSYLA